MIKVKRSKIPKLKVYTVENQNLNPSERKLLLKLIKKDAIAFKKVVSRLKDSAARFTKAEKETLQSIAYYADPKNFVNEVKITTKKAPNFSVYKDPEIKEELKSIFTVS